MKDFYIGYVPRASRNVARKSRTIVVALALLAAAIGAILVAGQQRFESVTFAYGSIETFHGVIEAAPVPLLRVRQPGLDAPESLYPLVAPGKHGVAPITYSYDGREVELQATLIFREGATMLEVIPESMHPTSATSHARETREELGPRTLTGEIVDTKCYIGVMNPGQGKVHRDCAARCISGGIPPALLSDGTLYYLVAGDQPLAASSLMEFVSRPVVITGSLRRHGNLYYLDVPAQGIACARERLKD
jgi:hypothetical protein